MFRFEGTLLCEDVTPRRGVPYTHRCEEGTFRRVVDWIDDNPGALFTLSTISDVCDLPSTQVALALRFLSEFGLIEKGAKRHNLSTRDELTLEALTCWFALREGVDAFEGSSS